jgi:hypothetical protein
MTRAKFVELIASVLRTRDDEIVCSEFFESLPRYVELVAGDEASPLESGATAQPLMPQVAHHIAQCAECAEEYEMLLEMMRAAPP